jgi:hypothetical protein
MEKTKISYACREWNPNRPVDNCRYTDWAIRQKAKSISQNSPGEADENNVGIWDVAISKLKEYYSRTSL